MSLLGVHLTLLIGPTVAVPAPALLTQRLESAEVTHTDEGRSGFQLIFQAGRSGTFASKLRRVNVSTRFTRLPHVATSSSLLRRTYSAHVKS